MTWRALVSPTGSWFSITNQTWELVPHPSSSRIQGVRWFLIDRNGKRVRSLFLTPSGQVGSRWEVKLEYLSHRLTTDKRRAWARSKLISRLDAPTSLDWARSHPDYLPKRPRLTRKTTHQKITDRLRQLA
jgi:hypothetical protein